MIRVAMRNSQSRSLRPQLQNELMSFDRSIKVKFSSNRVFQGLEKNSKTGGYVGEDF